MRIHFRAKPFASRSWTLRWNYFPTMFTSSSYGTPYPGPVMRLANGSARKSIRIIGLFHTYPAVVYTTLGVKSKWETSYKRRGRVDDSRAIAESRQPPTAKADCRVKRYRYRYGFSFERWRIKIRKNIFGYFVLFAPKTEI